MDIIKHLKPISFTSKLLGICLFLLGLYIFVSNGSIFWTILMFGFGSRLLSTSGSQIDLENKRYRTIYSLFGVNIGKWKALPSFDYISVFKTKKRHAVRGAGAETHADTEVYEINMFYNTNEHICFYQTDSKEDAFNVANHYSLTLNLKILDSTVTPSVWLERNTSF